MSRDHVRYGVATTESFFDLSARRHLMPSVMDWVPPQPQRCACPGPKRTSGDVPCIQGNTAGDQLCDACRSHCHGDAGSGNKVMFIHAFGPAFPLGDEPEPQRQHRRERVGLTDSIVIDTRKD